MAYACHLNKCHSSELYHETVSSFETVILVQFALLEADIGRHLFRASKMPQDGLDLRRYFLARVIRTPCKEDSDLP